jgi:Domain of unknown function (DUF4262)
MKSRRRVNSTVGRLFLAMIKHDPRCEASDQKVLDDVKEYGWHVMKVLDQADSPGWAYSIGLYHTFHHPEIVVFGLNPDLMHFIINSVGEDVRSGKRFEEGKRYADLIEAYLCTFKPVNVVWHYKFLGYGDWFYKGSDYPVLQCIWPDKNSYYPWDPGFNPNWLSAQPLLFNGDPTSARTTSWLRSMNIDAGG